MKISKAINFDKITERKVFDNTSAEYKKLDALNEEGEWKEYCNEMLSKGISVVL
jgi:hypothetical protein